MRSIMRLWVFLVVLVSLVAAPTTVASANAVDAASMPAASAAAASPGFVPLSPSRLLDTRSTGVPVRPGTAVPVVVVGRSGVPASGVGAVVVNLTAVSPGAAGYVTAYASGAAVPVVSNLNYATGQTVANQAVVQVGSGGRIDVKTSAAAHLLVDVVGYSRSGEAFVPVAPRRVLDTRSSTPVTGGTARTVSIGGLPATGVAGYDDSGQVKWAEGAGLAVVRGAGRLTGERTVQVGDRTLSARRAVVVATGSTPVVPPEYADVAAWGSRDATGVQEVPERLVIVGGGVVACEAATWMAALGSRVTMLVRGDRLLANQESFASEVVLAALQDAGVGVRLGADLTGCARPTPATPDSDGCTAAWSG